MGEDKKFFPSITVKVKDLIPYARNSRTHSEEQWMPLDDYDYEISNFANVRRSKASKGTKPYKPINPSNDGYGRKVFNVSKNGKVKQLKLHRAVLQAFCGNCPEGFEVAHLDGNQLNNHLSNLIYATPKENNGHKILHGTQPMGESVYIAKLNEKQVLEIRASYPFLSYSKLANQYGVHIQTIAKIITRKTWKHI